MLPISSSIHIVSDRQFKNIFFSYPQLSFGFGANAGLGPSCLSSKNKTASRTLTTRSSEMGELSSSSLVKIIRWIGWGVLFTDLVFLGFSIHFLIRIFRVSTYIFNLDWFSKFCNFYVCMYRIWSVTLLCANCLTAFNKILHR